MEAVKPGTYTARVVEYGLPDPEPGRGQQVRLVFEFQERPGQPRRLTWYGNLSTEKAISFTLKTLIIAGMRSNLISTLTASHCFNPKDVKIDVVHEDYEGKTRVKIRYINDISGEKFESLAPEKAKHLDTALESKMRLIRTEIGTPVMKHENPDAEPDFDLGAAT